MKCKKAILATSLKKNVVVILPNHLLPFDRPVFVVWQLIIAKIYAFCYNYFPSVVLTYNLSRFHSFLNLTVATRI